MELLRFIFIGLVAGWIIGKIRRGRGYGFFGKLVIGAVGSVIGWFLKGLLNVASPNLLAQIVMAVSGAVVFFLLVGTFKWKRKRKSTEEDE